jgi:hypothetical protein
MLNSRKLRSSTNSWHKKTTDISNEIEGWIKEKEKAKAKLLKDGSKLTKDTHDTMSSLKRAKENYYKLHKAADVAEAAYNQKKVEPTAKQKEVDKLNKKAIEAKEKSNNADGNYKKVLEKANEHQQNFYTKDMPNLLADFQKFDEERTAFFKNFMEGYMAALNGYPPLLTKTCEALNGVVASVDAQADINAFIEANRGAAVTPPPDIDYEPYDSETGGASPLGTSVSKTSKTAPPKSPGSTSTSPSTSTSTSAPRSATSDKTWGLTAADEKLSVEEKKAKLEAQLKDITEEIASETKSKKGLDKLVKFYASDPGAQKKAVQEADDQQKKVDNLKEERNKITKQLEALGGGSSSASTEANGADDYEAGEYVEIKAKALFDYEAANDTELSFKAGDILTITEQDESGWWYAELNNKQGFVPNNYVAEIKD